MREIIRGVIVVLVALALLIGCLILIAEVGHWRLASDGVRAPQQSVRMAATAPVRSSPTQAGTAPAEPGLSVAIAKPAAERPRRVATAGVADAAEDRTKPPQVALSGPGKRAAGRAQASLLRVDDDSAGEWVGRYGKRGYSVAMAGEPTSLPPSFVMSKSDSHLYIWSPVTTDRRGLSMPTDPRQRSAGQWFSWDQFALDLDLRGSGEPFQVALYLLDWDSDSRAQRLDVMDAESGAVLLSRSDEHFKKGRYLLLRLSGHVTLRFTRTAGANCTLSGVFLDDVPAAAN